MQYFRLFKEAVLSAEDVVRIAGWDFHPQVALVRGDDLDPLIGPMFSTRLDDKPELDIYLRSWQFGALLGGTAAMTEQARWIADANPRLHLDFAAAESFGGARHHKVVVIDDSLAFMGGVDLTMQRWDEERRVHDPRRVDPAGRHYDPWHDVQVAFDGEAARWCGQFLREQWDDELTASEREAPWLDVEPDFEDVDLRIARSWPEDPKLREIEELMLDTIEGAEELLYVENQYLSHDGIIDAIGARLAAEDGPEVVLILPAVYRDGHEQATFQVERDRAVASLRERDEHGRLHVVAPWSCNTDDDECTVYVHAKVMIADDERLIIGSANLAERSMSVDTELACEVSCEHGARAEDITAVRHRLLSLHLGLDVAEVEARSITDLLAENEHNGPHLRRLEVDDNPLQQFPLWLADPKNPIRKQPELWLTIAAIALLTVMLAL